MRIVFDRVLDDLGRISIPKEIRRALGWRADDTIQLCADDDCVKIGKRIETNDDNDFHARWIPVSESLPEDGALSIVTYIRYDNGEPASDEIAYRDRGCWYWRFDSPENDEVVLVEITHWMPLPEPPKGE